MSATRIENVEKLRDKRVLLERELCGYSFAFVMKSWGMMVDGDDYNPATRLLDRFTDSQADVAVYSVMHEDDGEAILELPKEVGKKFVVFKNQAGLSVAKIAEVYNKIEEAEIPSIWENGYLWKNEIFAATLLRALGQESTR